MIWAIDQIKILVIEWDLKIKRAKTKNNYRIIISKREKLKPI